MKIQPSTIEDNTITYNVNSLVTKSFHIGKIRKFVTTKPIQHNGR